MLEMAGALKVAGGNLPAWYDAARYSGTVRHGTAAQVDRYRFMCSALYSFFS